MSRSGFKAIARLIEDGRKTAYKRMLQEAQTHGAVRITRVTSELIFHGSNIEFLSIGSAVHALDETKTSTFSTSADGQERYKPAGEGNSIA